MHSNTRSGPIAPTVIAVVSLLLGGCTTLSDYIHQGFKVGPNYCQPPAPVAEHWIDAADLHVGNETDIARWWTVFQDPVLDRLIVQAYQQNLTLREACFRILEAQGAACNCPRRIVPATTGHDRRLPTHGVEQELSQLRAAIL